MAKKKLKANDSAAQGKKSSKPEIENDESQVEGGLDDGDEDDVAPAKPAKKLLVKKPAKAEEIENDEGGEAAEDDDDVEAAPAPKKGAKVAAPAKKPIKKATDEDESVPTPASKKGGAKSAWGSKPEKERKALTPGSWMPQEEMMTRFHEKLTELGIAPPTKSITTQVIKAFESFLKDTLSEYDVKFIEKFRRREMEARVYAPNTELAQVATPYHTLVSPHRKVSLNLYFDKTMTKGTVNDDGEFIEGKFDSKGNFIAGKWGTDDEGNETFTPAAKKAKK
jgi:hypothetical protein